MKKVAIEWTDDSYDVVITVREATRADGLYRSSIRVTQYEKYVEDKAEEITDKNFQLKWWRVWYYPAIMAATEGWENRDPDKEQLPDELTEDLLLGLPDGLLVAWEAAVVKLNPSFFPFAEEKTEETTENGSTSDSSSSTPHQA